ncbi:ATP-binding protein [Tsukamurella sputi]|uniref:ATP-binding protein n=1 Tax=Tsukamurella sputi TaxID=2591848 RepID=A0A5C5RIZ2_9ACTN|nr:ATP-binding protein [Tsukamurella sputi]TWS22956.1 ATP-binding protein [Tsukamurella sputi]
MAADPFGTAALRSATLAAWRDSPTRAAEDLAAERDLVTVGYRDRVAVELAQNAADAASAAGVAGELAVWAEADGVHVANTGAPLSKAGVASLAALRVSPKSSGGSVGRFGVGFAAVLTVTEHVEIRSTGGGIEFSAERSRADSGRGEVAAMRLPYPVDTPPRAGFATEVVLVGADPALLAEFAAQAADLLLDLPALVAITVDDDRFTAPDLVTGHGPHARWVIGADARFLHAPTRTDEPLSLPVRVIADLPTTPDRRRLHPAADVALAARGYAAFVAAQPDPLRLLPPRRPPAGPVDALLREAIEDELRGHAWVPGPDGARLRPDRAAVLPGLTADLAALLSEYLPLVPPELSSAPAAAALVALGVRELSAADLADAAPRDREPAWYAALYAALDQARLPADDLGALPVPLADGRVVTGARGASLVAGEAAALALVTWARIVHPAAQHPLLERAGARRLSPVDLLGDPALREEVGRIDWESGPTDEDLELTEAVLGLLGEGGTVGPNFLGLLPVPGDDGALYPADELLAAAAPLREALGEDHPYGTVDPDFEARFPAEALGAIGVGWSFGVLREPLPTDPDPTLDGADEWWAQLPGEPDELIAVRDLDLVEHWEPAYALLAELPGVLDDPDGYTAWWLHTRTELGRLRSPDDPTFAGLLDPCTHPSAPGLRAALLHAVRTDADAQVLADALADPARTPAPAVVIAAHRAIAGHRLAELPARVRGIDGQVLDAESAAVLDVEHARFTADALVFGGLDVAADLADTLDLPLAGSEPVEILGSGARFARGAHPGVTLAQALGELPDAAEVEVHDPLEVAVGGTERRVPYVVVDDVLHVQSGGW